MGARKEKWEVNVGISHVYNDVLGKPRKTIGARNEGSFKDFSELSDGAEEVSSIDIIREIQKETYANTSNVEIWKDL